MEKFAVDLDKVLDELEYNEDRAETLMTSGGRRHISSVSPSVSEDHGATSLHYTPHVPLESGDSGTKWRPKTAPVSQKTSVSGVFSSLNEYINSGRIASHSVDNEDSMSTCPPPLTWSCPAYDASATEEKPDLIDTSTPGTGISTEVSDSSESQIPQTTLLPDIATAGTFIKPPSYEESNTSVDLITHNSNTSNVESVEESKTTCSLSNSVPSNQNVVISFGGLHVNEDIDDDELNEYLSDLEREELEQDLSEPCEVSALIKAEGGEREYSSSRIESQSESQNSSQRPPLDALSTESEEDLLTSAENHCPVGTKASVESNTSSSNACLLKELDVQVPNECAQKLSDPNLSELADTISEHSVLKDLIKSEFSEDLGKMPHSFQNSHLEDSENGSKSFEKCINSSDQLCSKGTTEPLVSQTGAPAEVSCGILQRLPSDSQAELLNNAVCKEDSQIVGSSDDDNPNKNTETLASSSESSSSIKSCPEEDTENELSNGSNEVSTLPTEIGESCEQEFVTPAQETNRSFPLTLSINETPDLVTVCSSPATPPTVPVTPTLVDPPVFDEFKSSVSTLSTPFMTPTAGCSESSPFMEESGSVEGETSCISTPETANAVALDSVPVSDTSLKPVRPSSLEIPVRTEPAHVESAGSSEESPVAFSGTVGPPGATPCANRPPIAESLPEPHGTDESATESSIEEGVIGAVGGEEPSAAAPAGESLLGKEPPFWVPDADAPCCMQCDLKFTVIKRRHHCRACGKVLCSKCCSEKAFLEYISTEARVCLSCKSILFGAGSAISPTSSSQGTNLHPNPNNPMEYCSTVPPLQQVAGSSRNQGTPTVMVPVGVLKREGSTKPKSEAKQVMFSDGIRPGADLAELDGSSEPRLSIRRTGRTSKRVGTPPGIPSVSQRTLPPVDGATMSYVPHGKGLPPIVIRGKEGIQFEEDPDPSRLMAVIKDDSAPPVKFTINRNLYMLVKILNLDCCVNRVCWCFTSDGLSSVGQDEIVIILEVDPEEASVPKDIFIHLNTLYLEAAKGNTVTEMGNTLTQGAPFLGSREHGGFLYVRPTFQCLHRLILPPAPYLVGVLIHKWETPWARVFPIRLMLRLGAEFRYYPCPLVSIRQRSAVYGEIGHTIIQVLADFRNMVYTLPTVRGLLIHMEDKQTTILLPRNRYDQVMRALNNSNDHVLAFGANFSQVADSHLVCMQSDSDHSYHTQAINIHNKPRKVTGASFVVFNGALKVSCGMAAKSTIVEDGLMVKVTSETMASLQSSLRDMKDLSITCGPINGPNESDSAGAGILPNDEVVLIKWTDDDRSFNIGVLSSVDGRPLDGVPSIRVHNGTDYHGEYRFIRWTEVFILESEEGSGRTGDPVDISRLSEQLAKATCLALVKLLDLLAAANLTTLAVRATIHPENVGYQAGSNGEKLPPIYMNSLDDQLVPVLHEAGLMSGESPAVLELVFRIMESG